jgi:hypothetical protein
MELRGVVERLVAGIDARDVDVVDEVFHDSAIVDPLQLSEWPASWVEGLDA